METSPNLPAGIHYLAQAMACVFRDQERYIGDPAYADIPLDKLLSPAYLNQIAQNIGAENSSAANSPYLSGSTTNFITADRFGNVVVVTQTINYFWGAGVAVPGRGYILNNQIADFTPNSESANAPAANKIPLSNMAPTMVFRDGRIALAIGSPGARRIVTALAQVLLRYLEGSKDLDDAVHWPRFHFEGKTLHVESNLPFIPELEELGYQIEVHSPLDLFFGGVTCLSWMGASPEGIFDPRRDGDIFLE